jgi:hypothetical protein
MALAETDPPPAPVTLPLEFKANDANVDLHAGSQTAGAARHSPVRIRGVERNQANPTAPRSDQLDHQLSDSYSFRDSRQRKEAQVLSVFPLGNSFHRDHFQR